MNHFLCALRPTGELIHKTDVFGFLARLPRDIELETIADGPFLGVAATGSQTMRPLLARYRHARIRCEPRGCPMRLSHLC